MSLREQIIQSNDLKREEISISEWGATFYVTELSGKDALEYNEYVESFQDGRKKNPEEISPKNILKILARMVRLVCVDEEGERVFLEEDEEVLQTKAMSVLTRISELATRMSGISEEALEEAKNNLKNVN